MIDNFYSKSSFNELVFEKLNLLKKNNQKLMRKAFTLKTFTIKN